jgi:hypothetical protein
MGEQTGCYADSLAANPNRPTVSNPAHVTQYGVLELEYGWDRLWPQEGIHQTSVGGLLKFGLLCDIELRWNTTSFLSQTDVSSTHRTFGDNWLGTEIRFHRQTARLPTMAFNYAFKVPSASTENGLGSGRVDHSFTFGASENIARFNFDFNFTQFLIGRTTGSGFDENQQLALAFSHAIHGGLQFAGEFYGETELNPTTPGFASSLWALTYTVVPRLVIDGGFEVDSLPAARIDMYFSAQLTPLRIRTPPKATEALEKSKRSVGLYCSKREAVSGTISTAQPLPPETGDGTSPGRGSVLKQCRPA